MKISVLTPSIRPEGLKIVEESLAKQTIKDFEWLIGSSFVPFYKGEAAEHTKAREKLYGYGMLSHNPSTKWINDDFKGGFWSLNRVYNKLFQKASGDIIVSLQDFIWIPKDGLQKLVDRVVETDGVVSGVGDQYARQNRSGKPTDKIWNDPRKTDKYGDFYECNPEDAEWNWCGFPKHWIFDVGGMDEQLDFMGYGGDQYQVGERLDEMGCKFYLDQTNKSFTLRHDRSKFGGQENWDKNHVLFNGKYQERKKQLQKEGKWPVLDCLH